jgi:hypothetical protein
VKGRSAVVLAVEALFTFSFLLQQSSSITTSEYHMVMDTVICLPLPTHGLLYAAFEMRFMRYHRRRPPRGFLWLLSSLFAAKADPGASLESMACLFQRARRGWGP